MTNTDYPPGEVRRLLQAAGHAVLRAKGRELGIVCPECGDPTHASVSSTTGAGHCFKCDWRDHLGGLARDNGGQPVRPALLSQPSETPAPKLPSEAELARWQAALTDGAGLHLEQLRGLSAEVIEQAGIGWDSDRQAYTLPVKDGKGQLVGLRLYRPDAHDGAPKYQSWPGTKAELYPAWLLPPGTEEAVVCEGEFDALLLRSQGFEAITGTAGAGTFRPEWATWLRERGVKQAVVCYDADVAGRQGARKAAALLHEAGLSVKLPAWPEGSPPGHDVGEALWPKDADPDENGATLPERLEAFGKLLAEAKPYEPGAQPHAPPAAAPELLDWPALVSEDIPEIPWLIEGLLPEGSLGSHIADVGSGKTWLAYDMALSVASGAPMWGHFAVNRPGAVLLLDEESGRAEVSRRLSMLARGRGLDVGQALPIYAYCHAGFRVDEPDTVGPLREKLAELKPVLLILDSLVRFHSQDENSASGMAKVTAGLRALSQELGCAIWSLHHPRKLGMVSNASLERIRGSKEIAAGGETYLFSRPTTDGDIIVEVPKQRVGEKPGNFVLRLEEDPEGGMSIAYVGEAGEVEDKLDRAEAIITQAVMDAGGRLDRKALLAACQAEGIKPRTAAEALKRASSDGGTLAKAGKDGRNQLYALASEALL